MSLLGSYLILKIDGDVIAETTSVSLRLNAKPLDSTSYDSGMNAEFISGKVTMAMAGTFLLATTGANWSVLWEAFRLGTLIDIILYRDYTQMLQSSATIVKLRMSGGDSGQLITGGYGLLCTNVVIPTPEIDSILTEDSYSLQTEDEQVIIQE